MYKESFDKTRAQPALQTPPTVLACRACKKSLYKEIIGSVLNKIQTPYHEALAVEVSRTNAKVQGHQTWFRL